MADFWGVAADRLENPATDPDSEWAAARHRWLAQARPDSQIPDALAPIWIDQAGRGSGKTRSAMEAVSEHCRNYPGARVALVGRSFSDGRDVLVEGAGSGLLAVIPPSVVAGWNRSMGELRLVNGALLSIYSDTEPDRLRGPQFSRAVCDELASWTGREAWDQLLLACRLGKYPQVIVTTTPRPTPLFRELVEDPRVKVVRESTFANLASLAQSFRDSILSRYAGTTIGRQEIEAELLLDVEGAMWTLAELDAHRVERAPEDLRQVVVGVDPAGGSKATNDETGIVVCARDTDGRGYVLADRSGRFSPHEWARLAIAAYREFRADAIIAEKNFGGEMVEHTIRTVDPKVPVKMVSAVRGKAIRAQPIAALYEQGRISHVGRLADMESQLCTWTEDSRDSPDRLDGMIWGMSEVMEHLASGPATVVTFDPRRRRAPGDAVRGSWRPPHGSLREEHWNSDWGSGSLFSPPEAVEPRVRRCPKGTFDDIFYKRP
jgi:predicted phage terminase large subunit-like protein